MMRKIRLDERLLFGILAFSLFFLIVILPLVYMFISGFSLQGYLQILIDKRLQTLFIRTLEIGIGASVLSTILGLVFAVILERTDIPFRNYLKVLVILPLLIPPYIMGISWLMFLPAGLVTLSSYHPPPDSRKPIIKQIFFTRHGICHSR